MRFPMIFTMLAFAFHSRGISIGSGFGLRGPVRQEPTKGAVKKIAPSNVEMVYVPTGNFIMGAEKGFADEMPPRTIYLDGFWIAKNDVTVAQFRAYCQATSYKYDWETGKPKWGWSDDYPMVMVTWDDARAYCKWAGGDLPTEAQWEKAARGEDGRKYPWGDIFNLANLCCSTGKYGSAGSPSPAGRFPSGASPYGCLDMAGNVWQWCLDWYGPFDSTTAKNPTGPASGTDRVLRGGSWYNANPSSFRCAGRYQFDTTLGLPAVNSGFRLAARP